MREFIAVDFETANPQRVSACAFGFARVQDGAVTESNSYLIKPVGGHAAFQSKIHGITQEHTFDKPDFGALYPLISTLFESQLVAHSLFDEQVLRALANHFDIHIQFKYFDTSRLAKERLPELPDHKLKTLAKHFDLPAFQFHDAKSDAMACAQICLKLHQLDVCQAIASDTSALSEFKGMIRGILADATVNYKEACELLYWLDDNESVAAQFPAVKATIVRALEDGRLDAGEAQVLSNCLHATRQELDTDKSH